MQISCEARCCGLLVTEGIPILRIIKHQQRSARKLDIGPYPVREKAPRHPVFTFLAKGVVTAAASGTCFLGNITLHHITMLIWAITCLQLSPPESSPGGSAPSPLHTELSWGQAVFGESTLGYHSAQQDPSSNHAQSIWTASHLRKGSNPGMHQRTPGASPELCSPAVWLHPMNTRLLHSLLLRLCLLWPKLTCAWTKRLLKLRSSTQQQCGSSEVGIFFFVV